MPKRYTMSCHSSQTIGNRTSKTALLLALIAQLLVASRATSAGEWPQILGPNRNGIADNEVLADSWPNGAPPMIWQRKVGAGFAGVAVERGRAILFHRVENNEIVEALDAESGKPLWKTSFPTRYISTIAQDDGPRCVPLIYEGFVFLLGAGGELHCVSFETGDEVWQRSLEKDFGAQEGYFGAGSTPIVHDDLLLVNVGGRSGAGLVAFALDTGKTVWQAGDEDASYSSPTATKIAGQEQVIFVTRYNVVGVNPSDGKVLFRFPFGKRGPTVNAATPLVIDGNLFVSASYGVGAVASKLTSAGAKKIWENNEVMSSQYTTSVYHDGYLYGIHGRQDIGVAELRCIDPVAGKVMWTEEGFGTGNLILADDKLVIMKTDGTLVLAQPSPDKFRPMASAQVLNNTVQPLPALAGGRLYVRDTDTLKSLDLRPNAK